MNTPLYRLAKASAQVQALLGSPELRIYPWGENSDPQRRYPYVTLQVVSGQPEHYLACRPDMDHITLQVDVWALSESSAVAVTNALRDAIELHCYITAWRGTTRDGENTKVYRNSFDCAWIVPRS